MAKVQRRGDYLQFECPGCDCFNQVRVAGEGSDPKWQWNGSMDAPTLTPSILATHDYTDGRPRFVCHSFMRDGKFEFLSDSTHKLSGQTVDVPDMDASLG